MALDAFLLSILQDPTDRQPLLYVAEEHLLYNPRTRRAYDVRGEIPVLLPSEAREVDEAEHARLVQLEGVVSTGSRD